MRQFKRQADRGAAMVEMGLILPILIVLTFGVMEYGWVFLRASQVNNAARQGARIAARPDADSAEVEAAILQVMTQAKMEDSGYSVVISDLNVDPGLPVSVKVTVEYAEVELIGFAWHLFLPQYIKGAATMAKEGPSI